MLGKLAVFGVGYIVGTRAGRERYEVIRIAATKMAARLDDFSQGSRTASHGIDRDSETSTRP